MSDAKGYYSLIQYTPNPARAESVNLGVLLFCPDKGFLETKINGKNDRVTKVFGRGSFDKALLDEAKDSLKLRLQHQPPATAEQLEQFIGSRGNDITLTPARTVRVSGDPAKALASLYKELVDDSGDGQGTLPAIPALDDAFRRPTLQGLVKFKQSVEIPKTGQRMTDLYSYQNGVLNYVKPQVFKSSPMDRAEILASRGHMLHKYPDDTGEKRKLIVVSQVAASKEPAVVRKRIDDLLTASDVRVVWPEDISAFAEEVEREAHE